MELTQRQKRILQEIKNRPKDMSAVRFAQNVMGYDADYDEADEDGQSQRGEGLEINS